MTETALLTEVDDRGIATIALSRPEVHNAYNGPMIDQLGDALRTLGARPEVRIVVLRGRGKHFQAGADLNWLRALAAASPAENADFSWRTTEAMHRLNALPKPTLALVQGACYGGGVGLVASCDVAIACEGATFALTEVRWGVVPAPIVPQLCAAIGVRQARRYGISGERFDAREALRIGLVHAVCPDGGLDAAAAPILEALLQSAPGAVADTKLLFLEQANLLLSEQRVRALAFQAALKRTSPEAAEGLESFQAKRRPAWHPAG